MLGDKFIENTNFLRSFYLKKKTLAYLSYSETFKHIAEKDPILLFLMCHIKKPEKFRCHIFDFEIDYRELAKFDIVDYNPPKNRPTHSPIPKLRSTSKRLIQELIDNGICKELSEFFEKKDENQEHITIKREDFRRFFKERFTFEEDPNNTFENKLSEIRKIHKIAPNGYVKNDPYGNQMKITYNVKINVVNVTIDIDCFCSNKCRKEFPVIEYLENKWNLNLFCNECKKTFYPSFNFLEFGFS